MSADPEALSTKRERDWLCVLFHLQLWISFFCSLHFLVNVVTWTTIFYTVLVILLSFLGVAAGAHRLWAHRSYTASAQLRFFLALCQTLAGCGSIYDWVRWHRLHHKHFGTALDPYNPNRGWFYAHIVGTTQKLSAAQEAELRRIDMADLEADRIVMFQHKYYIPLYVIVTLLLTINAPAEYWAEDLVGAIFVAGWLRYFIVMQLTWLINSATRIWCLKPGEKYPCDTNLVFILSKNYWLSYHYLAPWDYQTSEYSKYGTDCVSKFIRVCAALEYASELKTVDSDTVRRALFASMETKRDITATLLEEYRASSMPDDHYLTPSKFREDH